MTKRLGKTPYELWRRRKPDVSYFKVFGSKCYIHNNGKSQLKTFDPKAERGIFLGYAARIKAYRVFNNSSNIVEITPHVRFDESTFECREQAKRQQFAEEPTEPQQMTRSQAARLKNLAESWYGP